jgi:hypothetical protein
MERRATGIMQVYGEDATANPAIPGFREGEVLAFRVNGIPAEPGTPLEWHDDWASHETPLHATTCNLYLPIALRR